MYGQRRLVWSSRLHEKKSVWYRLGMALEDRRSSLFQHGSKGVSEATS